MDIAFKEAFTNSFQCVLEMLPIDQIYIKRLNFVTALVILALKYNQLLLLIILYWSLLFMTLYFIIIVSIFAFIQYGLKMSNS